ncbi:hypothetical protein BC828DRAFT_417724 [Blastocladiella britannica]|nr:hypothetical protein BC828DRAFT_417724 [Blastocladiella britannica]
MSHALVAAFIAGAAFALAGVLVLAALAVVAAKRVLAGPPRPPPLSPALAALSAARLRDPARRTLERLLRPPSPPSADHAYIAPDGSSGPGIGIGIGIGIGTGDDNGHETTTDSPFCMGWLNVYRVPLDRRSATTTSSAASPVATSTVPPPAAIPAAFPTSTPHPYAYPAADAKYGGASARYAAAHLAPSSVPGGASSSSSNVLPSTLSPRPTVSTIGTPPVGSSHRLPVQSPRDRLVSTDHGLDAHIAMGNNIISGNGSGGVRAFERSRSPTCFGVLRHHSLFLYEDETLLDCVGVVVVPLHEVSLHAPETLRFWDDSECMIKDAPIRLQKVVRRRAAPTTAGEALESDRASIASVDPRSTSDAPELQREYFLYAMNAVEKEAWYLALRKVSATGARERTHPPPFSRNYVALRETLAASPADDPALWLNAFIGRAFLSLQDHPLLIDLIVSKITKKIERLPVLPGFLAALRVRDVWPGLSVPVIRNPTLVRCDAYGHVEIELDVDYVGGARVEIAADVVLSVGSTVAAIAEWLGAGSSSASASTAADASTQPDDLAAAPSTNGDLRVPVVLGITLARLSGRLRVILRPPPSNRAWIAFVTAPEITVRASPVVNTRHLRLAVLLDLIEAKVRELMVASMVLPNMEDICIAPSVDAVEGGRFYPRPVPAATAAAAVAYASRSNLSQQQQPTTGSSTASFSSGSSGSSATNNRPGPMPSLPTSSSATTTPSSPLSPGPLPRARTRSVTSIFSLKSARSSAKSSAPPPQPLPTVVPGTIPGAPAPLTLARPTFPVQSVQPPLAFTAVPPTVRAAAAATRTFPRAPTATTASTSTSDFPPIRGATDSGMGASPSSGYPRSVKSGFSVAMMAAAGSGTSPQSSWSSADEQENPVSPTTTTGSSAIVSGVDDDDHISVLGLRHRHALATGAADLGLGHNDSVVGRVRAESVGSIGAGGIRIPDHTDAAAAAGDAGGSPFSLRSLFWSAVHRRRSVDEVGGSSNSGSPPFPFSAPPVSPSSHEP